jgi:hypothetical protein
MYGNVYTRTPEKVFAEMQRKAEDAARALEALAACMVRGPAVGPDRHVARALGHVRDAAAAVGKHAVALGYVSAEGDDVLAAPTRQLSARLAAVGVTADVRCTALRRRVRQDPGRAPVITATLEAEMGRDCAAAFQVRVRVVAAKGDTDVDAEVTFADGTQCAVLTGSATHTMDAAVAHITAKFAGDATVPAAVRAALQAATDLAVQAATNIT